MGEYGADLSDLAGRGVFKRRTEDPSEFAQATVDPESGTVVWPGGPDVARSTWNSPWSRSGRRGILSEEK